MFTEEQLYGLTARQRAILNFIASHHEKKGFAPSMRDIAKGVKLSSASSVHRHIKILTEKGYIRRNPSKSRAIEVLIPVREKDTQPQKKEIEKKEPVPEPAQQPRRGIVWLPLMKGYDPELPFFDEDNVKELIPLSQSLVGDEPSFLIEMDNESMLVAGILPGDLCIMRKREIVEEGKIAAVAAGDQMTIKRVFSAFNAYRLEPENRRMMPVHVRDIEVLGVFGGIIRVSN